MHSARKATVPNLSAAELEEVTSSLSDLIYLTGKQRTLSHRVVLHASLLPSCTEDKAQQLFAKMKEDRKDFDRVAAALQTGDADMRIPALSIKLLWSSGTADRRAIDEQLVRLRRQLDKVVKTRTLHRDARAKVPFPIVALVGYTNAGKSTLFNRLTGAAVMAKDMLFATLDPTMRKIELDGRREVILSDTVGFISDLPTELVAAFRATLEEVTDADLRRDVIRRIEERIGMDAIEQQLTEVDG